MKTPWAMCVLSPCLARQAIMQSRARSLSTLVPGAAAWNARTQATHRENISAWASISVGENGPGTSGVLYPEMPKDGLSAQTRANAARCGAKSMVADTALEP